MKNFYTNLCLSILIIVSILFFSFKWADETFTNMASPQASPPPMTTKYDILYTPEGVKDIIQMQDRTNHTTLTYMDDITKRRPHRTCPPGTTYDITQGGCIPQCPPGTTYDARIQGCAPVCLPFQTLSYTNQGPLNDTSAVCVAKCWDIQYYDIYTGSCQNCPVGYTGDGNNNCIVKAQCPHGQVPVDNYGTCVGCPPGKILNDQYQCDDICPPHKKYNSDGTCSLKCPAPNQYSDPLYGCINCPTGYLVDGSNVCQPRPPCPVGHFLDNAGIECVSECPYYDKYDPTNNICIPICTGANPIYDKNTIQCVPCPAGQIYSGSYNTCIPGPTTPPPTCPPGFQPTKTGCESVCPHWRMNNAINPGTCDLRCPSKTQFFDDKVSFGCVDCPTGFTVDAYNSCTVPVPTTPAPTCGPGYIRNSTTRECDSVCPIWRMNDPKNPRECALICPAPNQYYDAVYNYGCANCPAGYGVDNNNQCTIALPPPPPPPPPSVGGGGTGVGDAAAAPPKNPSVSNFSIKAINYTSGDHNSSFSVTLILNVNLSNNTAVDHYDVLDSTQSSVLPGPGTPGNSTVTTKPLQWRVNSTNTYTLKMYDANGNVLTSSSGNSTINVQIATSSSGTSIPQNAFYYSYSVAGAGGGGGGGHGREPTGKRCKGCCCIDGTSPSSAYELVYTDGGPGGSGGDGEVKTGGWSISTSGGGGSVSANPGKGGKGGIGGSSQGTEGGGGGASTLTIGGGATVTAQGGGGGGKGGLGRTGSTGSTAGSGGGGKGGTGGVGGNDGGTGSPGADGSVQYTIYYANIT